MASASAIAVNGLCFSYQDTPLLKELNFSVTPGELVAVVGPNGSGKTTLLKILLGLLSPTAGTVNLFERPLSSYAPKERAKIIAYVAQQPTLSFPLNVKELVTLGRYPHGKRMQPSREDNDSIDAALQHTSASHLRDRSFNTLSGGEKQKVLIARALAQSTPILLLDEPTLHLDLYYQLQILAALKQLCAEQKMSVVTVLHDINLVSQFADKALLLQNGRLCAFGAVADVITETRIKELLGVEMKALEDQESGTRFFAPRKIV